MTAFQRNPAVRTCYREGLLGGKTRNPQPLDWATASRKIADLPLLPSGGVSVETLFAQWPYYDPEQRPLVWHENEEILLVRPPEPRARPAATPTLSAPKPHTGLPNQALGKETAMQLTGQRRRQFTDEGWPFLPSYFSEARVALSYKAAAE